MVQLWRRWCRLCAKEDFSDTHINIFLKHEDVSQLAETINKCFSININSRDDWPQTICTGCHQLVAEIVTFTQRATKVQMMFAELLNNAEVLDENQIKAQYKLNELDDEEVKLFANTPTVQLFESKHSITADMSEQMVDLKELGYVDEDMINPVNIKTEQVDEAGHDSHEQKCDDKLAYIANIECAEEPKRTRRGRPRKCDLPKVKKKIKTFTCTECDMLFERYRNYRDHIKTVHGGKPDPSQNCCTKCNKTFNTAWGLKVHGFTHLPVDQKFTLPCPYCDKKFTRTFVVQAHIRAVHMGEKPFICEECGKTYRTSGALKEHKLTHTEDRPLKCNWCEKCFKTKSGLTTHEDTHNETNYICTTCGLQLNTRRTLKMHMVVHSDQKRHKCGYCGNEYKRAKALKNHLILHTGLTPYTCNFCEKSFANGANCRSHKKKTHPVELAAMEAAGTKSITTNIPKLKQLRVVTSNKAVILEQHKRVHTFEQNCLQITEYDESLRKENSPTEEQSNQHHSSSVHEVFGSMSAS